MSLIKCPECEKNISDTSKSCIHCGYKLKNTSKEIIKNSIIIVIIVALLVIVGLCIKKIIVGAKEADEASRISSESAEQLSEEANVVVEIISGND